MENIIAAAVLAAIIAGVVIYLVRQKRRGVKCVGCPHAAACSAKRCSGK